LGLRLFLRPFRCSRQWQEQASSAWAEHARWLPGLTLLAGFAWALPCVMTDMLGGYAKMNDAAPTAWTLAAYPPYGACVSETPVRRNPHGYRRRGHPLVSLAHATGYWSLLVPIVLLIFARCCWCGARASCSRGNARTPRRNASADCKDLTKKAGTPWRAGLLRDSRDGRGSRVRFQQRAGQGTATCSGTWTRSTWWRRSMRLLPLSQRRTASEHRRERAVLCVMSDTSLARCAQAGGTRGRVRIISPSR